MKSCIDAGKIEIPQSDTFQTATQEDSSEVHNRLLHLTYGKPNRYLYFLHPHPLAWRTAYCQLESWSGLTTNLSALGNRTGYIPNWPGTHYCLCQVSATAKEDWMVIKNFAASSGVFLLRTMQADNPSVISDTLYLDSVHTCQLSVHLHAC